MTPQSDKFYLMALCTLKAKGITRLKCLDTLLSATYTKCCSPVFTVKVFRPKRTVKKLIKANLISTRMSTHEYLLKIQQFG